MRALPILLVVLLSACITQPQQATTTIPPEPPECANATDCDGKTHENCMGHWTCLKDECKWKCTTILPAVEKTQKGFTYSITGCDTKGEEGANTTNIQAEKGIITINQTLNYYCCAALELTLTKNKNAYAITETNHGKACRCTCNHHINAAIKPPAPGKYQIEIEGVRFQDEKTAKTAKTIITA